MSRRTTRTFTAHGRHGRLSGTRYPNGTIVYQWDAAPDRPSILEDMKHLEKNHQVKGIEYTE